MPQTSTPSFGAIPKLELRGISPHLWSLKKTRERLRSRNCPASCSPFTQLHEQGRIKTRAHVSTHTTSPTKKTKAQNQCLTATSTPHLAHPAHPPSAKMWTNYSRSTDRNSNT